MSMKKKRKPKGMFSQLRLITNQLSDLQWSVDRLDGILDRLNEKVDKLNEKVDRLQEAARFSNGEVQWRFTDRRPDPKLTQDTKRWSAPSILGDNALKVDENMNPSSHKQKDQRKNEEQEHRESTESGDESAENQLRKTALPPCLEPTRLKRKLVAIDIDNRLTALSMDKDKEPDVYNHRKETVDRQVSPNGQDNQKLNNAQQHITGTNSFGKGKALNEGSSISTSQNKVHARIGQENKTPIRNDIDVLGKDDPRQKFIESDIEGHDCFTNNQKVLPFGLKNMQSMQVDNRLGKSAHSPGVASKCPAENHENIVVIVDGATRCVSISQLQGLIEQQENEAKTCHHVTKSSNGIDTIICLDTSGSMAGEPLKLAKAVVNNFLDELEVNAVENEIEENVALVTFGESNRVLQHLTNNYDDVRKAIEDLQADGVSNLWLGLALCLTEISTRGESMQMGHTIIMPRIILITDGYISRKIVMKGQDRTSSDKTAMNEVIHLVTHSARQVVSSIDCITVSEHNKKFLGAVSQGRLFKPGDIKYLADFFHTLVLANTLLKDEDTVKPDPDSLGLDSQSMVEIQNILESKIATGHQGEEGLVVTEACMLSKKPNADGLKDNSASSSSSSSISGSNFDAAFKGNVSDCNNIFHSINDHGIGNSSSNSSSNTVLNASNRSSGNGRCTGQGGVNNCSSDNSTDLENRRNNINSKAFVKKDCNQIPDNTISYSQKGFKTGEVLENTTESTETNKAKVKENDKLTIKADVNCRDSGFIEAKVKENDKLTIKADVNGRDSGFIEAKVNGMDKKNGEARGSNLDQFVFGAHVKSLPGWEGHMDHQYGYGTIIGQVTDGTVKVIWENGDITCLKCGADGEFDVQPIENNQWSDDVIRIGSVVTRGKDWCWKDQDGGKGNIGVVTLINESANVVNVYWTSNCTGNYRFGFTNKFDVQLHTEGTQEKAVAHPAMGYGVWQIQTSDNCWDPLPLEISQMLEKRNQSDKSQHSFLLKLSQQILSVSLSNMQARNTNTQEVFQLQRVELTSDEWTILMGQPII